MPYTGRYAGPELTPEEQDVRAALFAYSPQDASEFEWVPVSVLYRVYCDWWARKHWRYDPDQYARLSIMQFGRAVRRVYRRSLRRCKRSFHGRQQWGYANMRGPLSVTTPPPRLKNSLVRVCPPGRMDGRFAT
jgi:hypothetical protein